MQRNIMLIEEHLTSVAFSGKTLYLSVKGNGEREKCRSTGVTKPGAGHRVNSRVTVTPQGVLCYRTENRVYFVSFFVILYRR